MEEPLKPEESNVNPDPEVQKKYTDNVLGGISIAFGIFTMITALIPCMGWAAWIPALIGVITGVIGIVRASREKVSYRLSLIGIALNIIGVLVFVIINVGMGNKPGDSDLK